MKSILLLLTVLLTACANPPTPQQVQEWDNAGHTIVRNGLSDYKAVVETTQRTP